jgi:hypothetical protein
VGLGCLARYSELTSVDLATFRMVVLADELLEGFFGHDLPASFQLEKTEEDDYHQHHQKSEGILGGLMNLVVTDQSVRVVHPYSKLIATETRTVSTNLPTTLALRSAVMLSGANPRCKRHFRHHLPPSSETGNRFSLAPRNSNYSVTRDHTRNLWCPTIRLDRP